MGARCSASGLHPGARQACASTFWLMIYVRVYIHVRCCGWMLLSWTARTGRQNLLVVAAHLGHGSDTAMLVATPASQYGPGRPGVICVASLGLSASIHLAAQPAQAMSGDTRLPVTVLCGFLGHGKSETCKVSGCLVQAALGQPVCATTVQAAGGAALRPTLTSLLLPNNSLTPVTAVPSTGRRREVSAHRQ